MIVVFGASGFLGSAIVNELAQNSKVVGVVRPSSDTWRLGKHENLSIAKISVDKWPEIVAELNPTIVICAQWAGVELLDRNNDVVQESNVISIFELAKVSVRAKCEKFIAFGSQAEANESTELIPERFLNEGNSSYGKAKSRLSVTLNELLHSSETEFIWPRVFSVYGPGETRNGILPSLVESIYRSKDFRLNNPLKKWSFLYIDDFVQALKLVIHSDLVQPVVNIGNPEMITILEICKAVDKNHTYLFENTLESKSGYFPSVVQLNNLGWSPKTKLSDGIEISTKAIRQRLGIKVP